MNVGLAIKTLLEERNLKQVDLLNGTGLSSGYLSQVVTGKQRDITLDRACAIADFFGMTIDDFVTLAKQVEQ